MIKVEISLSERQADKLVEYLDAVARVDLDEDALRVSEMWRDMSTIRAVVVMSAAVAVGNMRGVSS